jgi:cytochrome c5
MPPKGGNPDLADIEVQRAVVFMINKSGGNWKEPPPPANLAAAAPGAATASAIPAPVTPGSAAAPQTGTAKADGTGAATAATGAGAAAAASTGATTQLAAAGAAAKPDGKKVYDTICMACHTPGVAGAPKLGDKAAWAPRIKTGVDALHASALKGKGAMPPKGGNAALSDAEVSAAVDYMVSESK